MANDLSIEQINQHTNVMPSILDLHISQIADDEAFGFLLLELTIQNICRNGFITCRFMGLILRHGVRGNQSLFLHDSTDSTSGNNHAALQKFDFKFSSAIGSSILVENIHNGFH
ncbi:hypothetical protein D1872_259070 [compost metagenome]